jgi:DNA-binding NtrC family response regulator
MEKKFDQLSIHQKMEFLIADLIEKEVRLRDALREFEKIYLETAAKEYKGSKSVMAKALGLHRNTLHNRAKILKIKKLSGS